MAKPTILIIEDEQSLVEVLTYNLTKEGFRVLSAADGQEGLKKAKLDLPDLIILDLMLPVVDGLEVCRQLRSDHLTQEIRILMLTARGEESDEIVGFEVGANDYVTKPFKVKPLIHRIKALLKRPPGSLPETDAVAVGPIEINRAHHVARLDGQELQLTPTEFRLLWTLARQPGRTYTRAELMETSRGEDANSMERTMDVHIRSLRRKLGASASLIDTVRGVGYRFKPR